MSVPNQKTIIIHQSTEVPFVKLGIKEYREAFRKMPPATFALYLYLAGNKEGFPLELSKVAFENATGYAKSSYHRAYKELVQLGYIYEDNGSLNFATSPKIGTRGVVQDWESKAPEMNTPIVNLETEEIQEWNSTYSEMNTEINNRNNRENKKTDIDPKRIAYLKSKVTPEGQIKEGRNKGYWLNYIEPKFWDMSTDEKVRIVKDKAQLPWADAKIVVEYVLDKEEFNKKMDLYKSMGF